MTGDPAPGEKPTQPRVRANDWRSLSPPLVGHWTPGQSVTIVIPTHESTLTLPYVLAALDAQTYPDHLLEVVVVDDGSSPPVKLPELRPSRTRLVTTTESWGRAHACRHGAEVADGDVIHWLDSDMLLYQDHVEAQMRWHHMIDYAVVLGQKTFIDPSEGLPDVEKVRHLVAAGRADEIFSDHQWSAPHAWVEAIYDRSKDLATAGARAYVVHVGATGSVQRAMYIETGGFDSALKLGEDIELGYRLSQRGAVFIPERAAKSWHLGRSNVMTRELDVNRYNQPFLVDRVSQLRKLRQPGFRSYAVPYIETVIDTRHHDLDAVQTAVDGVLSSSIKDVTCLLLGNWDKLHGDRVAPMDDDDKEARLIRATYLSDPRVRLTQDVPESAFPAAFRAILPAGWRTSPKFLASVTADMDKRSQGLRSIMMADGAVARIERTCAVSRTARLRQPAEDKDDVLDAVYGSWWSEGVDEGFQSLEETRRGPSLRPPIIAPAENVTSGQAASPATNQPVDTRPNGGPLGSGWRTRFQARHTKQR